MKNKATRPLVLNKPSENDIRDYAYHLYEQSNCVQGRDVENWLEAKACLEASIPAHASHLRLHHHVTGHEYEAIEHQIHPETQHRIAA
jgi:Protein of unknown function (DUF2934)